MEAREPVQVDDRVGSRELLPELKRLHIPAEKVRLPFADAAFEGNGPAGPVKVGIERKTIYDLMQSMTTGRLSAHQLPGLVQNFDHRWIVVEGPSRPAKTSTSPAGPRDALRSGSARFSPARR